MFRKIRNTLSDPRKYFLAALARLQQQICGFFQNTPFFMQGQMDIHPKSRWHNPHFNKLTGGFFLIGDSRQRMICNLETWDNTRRDMLILLLRSILERNVHGDLAELGVYKGHTARLIHYYMPERNLHLFDTFEGFTDRSVASERAHTNNTISPLHFSDTSLDAVKTYILPQNNNVKFYKGFFPESIPDTLTTTRFAFVHLDADLYEPILNGLEYFYPKMSPGGIIIIHDYNAWPGARKAVDDFFAEKPEVPIPMPDKSGSALLIINSH